MSSYIVSLNFFPCMQTFISAALWFCLDNIIVQAIIIVCMSNLFHCTMVLYIVHILSGIIILCWKQIFIGDHHS